MAPLRGNDRLTLTRPLARADPGDVPLDSGPTCVIPSPQYKACARIDPRTGLHMINSEDGLNLPKLPEHLQPEFDGLEGEGLVAAQDENRMAVASEVLGEPLDELKLTCKAGTVVLVHHDVSLNFSFTKCVPPR